MKKLLSAFWMILENKGKIATLMGILLFIPITIRLVADWLFYDKAPELALYAVFYGFVIMLLFLPSYIKIKWKDLDVEVKD